jgi:glyoxylase-like metal-dependent hydrolase (beta-lactamase superfamily II)
MDELTLKKFTLGALGTNAYLIIDEKAKKAFLIDTPDGSEKIKEFIVKEKLSLDFIILTHGHFDHIAGLDNFDCPVYIHVDDKPCLDDAGLNGSEFFSRPITIKKEAKALEDGSSLSFQASVLNIIHTPGHTPGGICIKLNNWLFSGDTLFFDSVGRTDLPYGSHDSLIKAIKQKIMVLPPDTVVYPGHGPKTTVGREKESNQFLQDI